MRVSAAALPRFPPPGPGPRGPSSAPGYSPASPPSSPLPARLGPPGRGVPSLRCHGGAPSMPCSALPSPFLPRSPRPGAGPPPPCPRSIPPFPRDPHPRQPRRGLAGLRSCSGAAPGQPGLGWVPFNPAAAAAAAAKAARGDRAAPSPCLASVRGAGPFRAPILPELRGKRRLEEPGSARLGWEGAAGCLAPGVVSGSLPKFPRYECYRQGRRGWYSRCSPRCRWNQQRLGHEIPCRPRVSFGT